MIKLMKRILAVSGKYKRRIQLAFVFSFLKSLQMCIRDSSLFCTAVNLLRANNPILFYLYWTPP